MPLIPPVSESIDQDDAESKVEEEVASSSIKEFRQQYFIKESMKLREEIYKNVDQSNRNEILFVLAFGLMLYFYTLYKDHLANARYILFLGISALACVGFIRYLAIHGTLIRIGEYISKQEKDILRGEFWETHWSQRRHKTFYFSRIFFWICGALAPILLLWMKF